MFENLSMLIAAHYNPFGLRAFKKGSAFSRQRQIQKKCASQQTFGPSYFVRALPCIESQNDLSLYLSVVYFSDCPQPKERDLLLQQIHGISAAEKREIN